MIEENRTVLVVDDDKSILRGFRAILEKEGYLVDTAETGAEALKRIQTKSFDVILLDIRLPDANGTDLLPKMTGIQRQSKSSLRDSQAMKKVRKLLNTEQTIFW